MKTVYRIIGLFLVLPLLSGCNDSDDVAAIFTGKTWKLNMISKDGEGKMYDFWGGNEEKKELSMNNLTKKATSFTVNFKGTVDGDLIQGQVSGTTVTQPMNGQWSANGKNHEFRAALSGKDEEDPLARSFLEGLNSATSYDGDSQNLYLIYEKQGVKYRMFFRVAK